MNLSFLCSIAKFSHVTFCSNNILKAQNQNVFIQEIVRIKLLSHPSKFWFCPADFALGWDYLKFCQESECGEIVLTSIENDGMMDGYNSEILNKFRNLISRPLIMNGGCANPEDMRNILSNGADACMASSMFYFTKYSYKEVKEYLSNKKIKVRV